MNKVLYLINPKANEGTALKRWKKLRKKFSDLPQDPVDVTKVPDMTEFLKEKKPDIVMIAGGDGTINKICESVLRLEKQPLLSVIPLGFGNAMSYCLGVETPEKALFVVRHMPDKLAIDLFKTTIPEIPIGVFTMGIGFDAQIVHTRMYHTYIGFRSYVLAAFRSYFTHVERRFTLTVDHGMTMNAIASALIIANAPTIGRNFILSEDAKVNDAWLDCTLFSSHYAYLTNLRLRGFKHPLYSEKNKVNFRAKHIKISGDQFAQVDGDPAIHVKPIEIEILPKAVTFIRNKTSEIVLPSVPFV